MRLVQEKLFFSQEIPNSSVSEKSISLLSEICDDLCKPYIVYIPSSNYWRPDFRYIRYKKELEDFYSQIGVPFIDGEEVIDRNNLDDYAPKGPHLSIEGYRKMADLIFQKIFK